jgi:carbonic anhydrase/acetyltransferase-like protein (isoleucine patch superfamily)
MRIRHRGEEPRVDPSAYVAPTAVLVGRVRIGPRSRVLFGAVLNAEGSTIEIGECSIVSENAVLRAMGGEGARHPVTVGEHVLIGPHATLLGCTIQPFSYVAAGATVLKGAVVRSGCVVGVGAAVFSESALHAGMFLPPNTIAIGDPADIFSPDEKVTLASYIKTLRFGGIVPAADSPEERRAMLKRAAEERSIEYENHAGDIVVEEDEEDKAG